MKKIILLQAYNTYNNGSFMMALNLVNYLNKNSKEKLSFFMDLNTIGDLKRLKNEMAKGLTIERISLAREGSSIKNKILRKIERLTQNKKLKKAKPNAIIILGGDDLSEYYSKYLIAIELYKNYQLSKKIATFLVGQTIGPFTSWREKIASKYLKKSHIYTRDPLCGDYLSKKLKIKNFIESSDLAFLDLPNQNKNKNYFKRFHLKKEDYITLVPSGLINQYTSSQKDYILCWVKIIKGLLKNSRLKNKKIVLLPHVTRPAHADDRIVINEIIKKLNYKDKKRIIKIKDELLPSQARSILGNGFFTITGRMHAAISTFQMGKLAISLSYSVKYQGIVGEDMKREDLIIESKNDSLWESKEIVLRVNEKIDYLMKNNKLLKKEIKKSVDKLKKKSMNQITDINKKLEKIK